MNIFYYIGLALCILASVLGAHFNSARQISKSHSWLVSEIIAANKLAHQSAAEIVELKDRNRTLQLATEAVRDARKFDLIFGPKKWFVDFDGDLKVWSDGNGWRVVARLSNTNLVNLDW